MKYIVSNLNGCTNPFNPHKFADFEGWYYKIVADVELFVIPGIAQTDGHCFVMFWTTSLQNAVYYKYPLGAYSVDGSTVCIAQSRFGIDGITLRLDSSHILLPTTQELAEYKHKAGRSVSLDSFPVVSVSGEFTFKHLSPYPQKWFESGVMGFLGLMPFLQCYHGVGSFHHSAIGHLDMVTNDSLTSSLQVSGTGYTEKDWGRAFPSNYVWVQCHSFDSSDATLLLSVASVPLPFNIANVRGSLIIIRVGTQIYNFSTYTMRSRFRKFRVTKSEQLVLEFCIEKGDLQLSGRVAVDLNANAPHLRAPVGGKMKLHVEEWNNASLNVTLKNKKQVLFSGNGSHVGFECEGDYNWLCQASPDVEV